MRRRTPRGPFRKSCCSSSTRRRSPCPRSRDKGRRSTLNQTQAAPLTRSQSRTSKSEKIRALLSSNLLTPRSPQRTHSPTTPSRRSWMIKRILCCPSTLTSRTKCSPTSMRKWRRLRLISICWTWRGLIPRMRRTRVNPSSRKSLKIETGKSLIKVAASIPSLTQSSTLNLQSLINTPTSTKLNSNLLRTKQVPKILEFLLKELTTLTRCMMPPRTKLRPTMLVDPPTLLRSLLRKFESSKPYQVVTFYT